MRSAGARSSAWEAVTADLRTYCELVLGQVDQKYLTKQGQQFGTGDVAAQDPRRTKLGEHRVSQNVAHVVRCPLSSERVEERALRVRAGEPVRHLEVHGVYRLESEGILVFPSGGALPLQHEEV